MNRFIKHLCLLLGVYITPITSNKEIINLIKRLRPMLTDFELIRLGPNGNGGYLLPNDLENIEALFSPGVGSISQFESDCAELGMKVFLADKSVDGPSLDNQNFIFIKKFIGATISNSFTTLDEWVSKSNVDDNSDLILQMDIEGSEYETFFNITNILMNRFRIIVVEFHQLDLLFSQPYFNLYSNVFNKILQSHTCVHIHPNNCCKVVRKGNIEIPPVMEFTFLRNDRIKYSSPVQVLPHEKDFDSANNQSLVLPRCWY